MFVATEGMSGTSPETTPDTAIAEAATQPGENAVTMVNCVVEGVVQTK